jgi:type I restriction enzyme R subunit
MMTELGYVERPFLTWLSGKKNDPTDKGLGWTFRPPGAMLAFDRAENDPLVEGLLLPAIKRINPAIKTDEQARQAVSALRGAISHPDPLEANRSTLDLLRDGVPLVLQSGKPAVTVRFIAFESDKLSLNDFTVTNQYTVTGSDTVRADTVLLVNGIPLVLCEFKSYQSSHKDWKEGVNQVHRYMREAPQLLAPNIFSVSADEYEFRYGPVAYRPDSQQAIDLQKDHWRPWLSQYPVRRGYWNLPADQQDPDPVRAAVHGLLRPENVLDFLEHFVVFETKKGHTVKKVARYQQFEAANDIVNRVLDLYRQPGVASQDRTGLVWHTQGSGKSLTMIYAGSKLRRHRRLDNPTVLIVVDRRDLKTQIADDFESCDYPNVLRAMGIDDLKTRIAHDRRETIVTTLQCFQRMDDLPPATRDNYVALIDECHRSQKGKGEGFAMTLRAKLPSAFRFGFTGTPIDKTMINTHRDFGPVKDGKQERYLSYYGIRQAIRDGATLPVYYLNRQVPLTAEDEPLSTGFEEMCAEMEVEDEEEKDFVQRREAQWKKLARDPRRVEKVVRDVVEHFLSHPDPAGFKAQLVCVDRTACALYKDALDAELERRGIPQGRGWSDVVISAAFNDPPELRRFHYTKEVTDDKIEAFKLTRRQWEETNRDKLGNDRSRWTPELKVLIVCDRLLTGFDAPIEQVMYLDKPLRDHNLLQAMARTNRPMPEMGKANGLIVDYFGVFADLQKALNFDEAEIEDAAINWENLRKQVPTEVARCLEYFKGVKIEDTRESLFGCLAKLADERDGKRFKEDFLHLQTLWEALSPDECLYPHRKDYAFLCGMYLAYLRRNRRSRATHEELAVKTRELIRQHTAVLDIVENIPVYRIDANYLTLIRDQLTPEDRAAELEQALTKELIEEGGGNFAYKQLGQRLLDLLERKQAEHKSALDMLHDLEKLVADVNHVKKEPERLGLQPEEYALFQAIKEHAAVKEEGLMVSAAKGLLAQLRQQKRFPSGWADNDGGRKKVRLALQVATWDDEYEALQLAPPEADADSQPFLKAAVERLAAALP